MPKVTPIAKGAVAGLVAGIPQVLLTQAEVRLLGLPKKQADIGPRFVGRLAQNLGTSFPKNVRWLLAGAFHFAYAGGWGALYALLEQWQPAQPHVGGPLLGSVIYAAAFSPWGGATQTGTERPVETRPTRETLVHWTAALSFALTAAYVYAWLDARPPSPDRGAPFRAVASRIPV